MMFVYLDAASADLDNVSLTLNNWLSLSMTLREWLANRPELGEMRAELGGQLTNCGLHGFRGDGRLAQVLAAIDTNPQEFPRVQTAAERAGFSGSAHLSAAFRQMFGIKPSDLQRLGVRFVGA